MGLVALSANGYLPLLIGGPGVVALCCVTVLIDGSKQ
jgi:hypothetical protein